MSGRGLELHAVRWRRGAFELRIDAAHAPAGQVTALIGHNGSGKSSLMRLVAGLDRPDAGSIAVGGTPIDPPARWWRQGRLTLLPQRPDAAAPFTVREAVAIGRVMHPEGPGEVESALEVVGLRDRADQRLATLSGGQQQRVAFARALHHHRAGGALLLDEPWSGVDPPEAARLADAVREVAKAGSTVLVAIHDLSMAAAVANQVWCLRDGQLVAAGDADRVLTEESVATALGTRVRMAAGADDARVMAIDYPATLRLSRSRRTDTA